MSKHTCTIHYPEHKASKALDLALNGMTIGCIISDASGKYYAPHTDTVNEEAINAVSRVMKNFDTYYEKLKQKHDERATAGVS